MTGHTDPLARDSGMQRGKYKSERQWLKERRWKRHQYELFVEDCIINQLPISDFTEWQAEREVKPTGKGKR